MNGELQCTDLYAAFQAVPSCDEAGGVIRFTTHCLYPTFEPVDTFVMPSGSGFVVHDGGGACRSAWRLGRDPRAIDHAVSHQASAYQLLIRDGALTAEVPGQEWLPSAIMAVANASATAARMAVESVSPSAMSESTLRDLVRSVLAEFFPDAAVASGFDLRGKSGKRHHFDFGVRERVGRLTLIDTVSPHHVSVSSRYVAFSDIGGIDGDVHGRFVVHDRPLDSEDVALLGQVADVVPFTSLKAGIARLSV
jgi:hypothetical protein